MKPTLLVLATGMGIRYGGLKQMDGLGPNGETPERCGNLSITTLQVII